MSEPIDRILERLDDERLERALELLPADGGDPEVADDGCVDLRSFGALCRGAFEHSGEDLEARVAGDLQAKRVAQKVLARTTREDLRRRGDVGLVFDFVAERMRQSALLRFAAALLLIQLTVVPLVAWHMLREPADRGLEFRFEPAPEGLEGELPARDGAGEVEGGLGALEGFDVDAPREDVVGLRTRLEAVAARLSGAAAPQTELGRVLAALHAVGDGSVDLAVAPRTLTAAAIDAWDRLLVFGATGETAGLATSLERLVALRASRSRDAVDPRALELCDRALAHASCLELALPEGSPELSFGLYERPLFDLLVATVEQIPAPGPFVRSWLAAVR